MNKDKRNKNFTICISDNDLDFLRSFCWYNRIPQGEYFKQRLAGTRKTLTPKKIEEILKVYKERKKWEK